MKIGILTLFHGNDNWGGTLQGIALKKLLEKLFPQAVVDIVDYRSNVNIIYQTKLHQAMQYGPIDIIKKTFDKINKNNKKQMVIKLKKRKKLFKDFRKPYLTNKRVYSDITLSELEQYYDCLICGSDQIWNPNVAKPGFFLRGIQHGCRKISYAASIARSELSNHERDIMIPLIEEFDSVSVREATAKNLLQKYTTKPIHEVLDPVLMLNQHEWNQVIDSNISQNNKPYVLAFFFSESLKYRNYIERYCEENGYELHFIPYANKYYSTDNKGKCKRLFDIGPKEFIEEVRDASCIFTDSFHGSVFSIVFQKEFCVFERDVNNRVSKNSRLYDLLEKFNLSNRLIRDPSKLSDCLESKIDYSEVNGLIKQYREQSTQFILNAIGDVQKTENSNNRRIDSLAKEDCCGCGLCIQICPKKCIQMKNDRQGFSYPEIIEADCINCGNCLKICQKKSAEVEVQSCKETYIAYNRNTETRECSSSGGLFHELATKILNNNGVVYGAAFGKNFSVKHMRIDDKIQLDLILRSKYVQSDFSDSIGSIVSDLRKGKTVLVSGTPCQIVAIKQIAKCEGLLEKLYLVDFVCHGVPSPGVWKSYLRYIAGDSEIHYVNFRDKKTSGWHDFNLMIKYGDDNCICESHEINAYMRSFLSDQNIRLSCYHCPFKNDNYVSDITLGDAWKIEIDKPEWADDRGTSLIIVRSKKGNELIADITNSCCMTKADYNNWTRFNPSIVSPTEFKLGRDLFFKQFVDYDTMIFWEKNKKIPFKKKIRYKAKRTLKMLGLSKIARSIGK